VKLSPTRILRGSGGAIACAMTAAVVKAVILSGGRTFAIKFFLFVLASF
jgi:hypothetical protein